MNLVKILKVRDGPPTAKDALTNGRNLGIVKLVNKLYLSWIVCFVEVAAGYSLYGSATMVVLSMENKSVHGFMLDPVRFCIQLFYLL